MEATAKQRNIRVPARKMRRVIDAIRGKSVKEASAILKFMPYFAAKIVEKNLNCAVANAGERWGSRPEELIVCEAYADDGTTYKRARPRAQGRMYKIQKRTSHIALKVRVSEKLKEELQEKKKKAVKPKATKKTPKAETKPAKATTAAKAPIVEEAKKEITTEVVSTEIVEVKKQEMIEQPQADSVETEEKPKTRKKAEKAEVAESAEPTSAKATDAKAEEPEDNANKQQEE